MTECQIWHYRNFIRHSIKLDPIPAAEKGGKHGKKFASECGANHGEVGRVDYRPYAYIHVPHLPQTLVTFSLGHLLLLVLPLCEEHLLIVTLSFSS